MNDDAFVSRCVVCDRRWSSYDPQVRLCKCVDANIPAKSREAQLYVTIFPEASDLRPENVPSLWSAHKEDVVAVSTDSPSPSWHVPQGPAGTFSTRYIDEKLIRHNLKCGNSKVFRSSYLERLTHANRSFVFDMSSYYWTSTLKDPRSWIIVSTALKRGLRDLFLWTAGNAGESLAKIVNVLNRHLSPGDRLRVHAAVNSAVTGDIRRRLTLWGCNVITSIPRGQIATEQELLGAAEANLDGGRLIDRATAWHVTDGWDGVGLIFYRLLATQVVRDIVSMAGPFDIFVPMGTGSLTLAFCLAVEDCELAGLVTRGDCRVVGVAPRGENITSDILRREPHGHGDESPCYPTMPKLTGTYSPLSLCLRKMHDRGVLEFCLVERDVHVALGARLLADRHQNGFAAEPSALSAFVAAAMDKQEGRNVIIVNTGMGCLGEFDHAFVDNISAKSEAASDFCSRGARAPRTS